MTGHGNTTNVIAVAESEKRKHTDQRMFQGVHATHRMEIPLFHHLPDDILDLNPESDRLEAQRWQIQSLTIQELTAKEISFFITDYLLGHSQSAETDEKICNRANLLNIQNLCLFITQSPSMVASRGGLNKSGSSFQI